MRLVGAGLVGGLLASGVGPLAAQETGTPVFQAPYRSFGRYEFGVGASFQRGSQTGIEGEYRRGFGQLDLALRTGLMIRNDVQDSFLIGVDARFPLIDEQRFPMRGALVTGIGLDVSGGASVWVPVGLALGRRLIVENSAVSLVPYVQPTVYFTTVGNDDVGVGLGLGLDLRLSLGFALRVSGGFGTTGVPEGVAVSAVWLR
ncbi:MAG: hypothetical protein OEW06_02260 [Gemmatimonadota bacterium]|nr:hypothetical protein [Gemmatimonadota bacterium]MDH4351065.1 hypothetical protein [Gemmatimonadota bacterium]